MTTPPNYYEDYPDSYSEGGDDDSYPLESNNKPTKLNKPLKRVVVSGSALLRILRHATRSLPDLCGGFLLGVDDDNGSLEITDCFGFPFAVRSLGQEEEEEGGGASAVLSGGREVEDVTEFTNDAMRMLKDVNADDNCVGWYRSVNTGFWCTMDLVEQQFERQEDLDLGTGMAKCVMLVYDPYQTENGTLSLKALRLTDTFMEIMRVRASNEANAISASHAAISHVRMNDVFQEIPVEIYNPPMIARFLGNLQHLVAPFAPDELDVDFDRLSVAADPFLEKNVALLTDSMEDLEATRDAALKYQREVQKQKTAQQKFVAQRKVDNQDRAARDLDPLPLRDESLPIFRPIRETSRLDALCIRKQIDVFCEQMNASAVESIEKLYLVSAAVQNKALSS